MIWNQISKLALIIGVVGLLFGCSHETSRKKPKDLSFGGITIGEVFPDSLKGSFRHCPELDLPTYEGGVDFKFPSTEKKGVSVIAVTDPDGGEVMCIDVMMLEAQAYDFYNMLKSKYGLPSSRYGHTDSGLHYFLKKVYEELGYEPYSRHPNISGRRALAEWIIPEYMSTIMMIADIYHRPKDRYRLRIGESTSEIETYITFRYVNKGRLNRVEREAEEKAKEARRNSYRQNNQEAMNQDF